MYTAKDRKVLAYAAGSFVVSFAVALSVLEITKPGIILAKPAAQTIDYAEPRVDHLHAVMLSAIIAVFGMTLGAFVATTLVADKFKY